MHGSNAGKMVAKISILKRLLDAINYNEKKVEKGKAECIHAGNYLNSVSEMNFYQKLQLLKNRDELNTRASTKTVHISLNFDPSEKLHHQHLVEIAETYMEKIGFGDQPFLVYKHDDAGHPHIHIVSTAIKEDGSRINTHHIGKLQSEKARKEIEDAFHLVKASSKKTTASAAPNPVKIEKIIYGKSETKESISRIVSFVFNNYNFSSLPEFNAALRQFNVIADTGNEQSRIFRHRGLVFRVLDETGNKIGVPIKSSRIGCKPTLPNLDQKFKINSSKKETAKEQTKRIIDTCLAFKPGGVQGFIDLLKEKNVIAVLRQSRDGKTYGITFVDNNNRCVFNGSEIGKIYSIAGLQTQLQQSTKREDIQSIQARTAKNIGEPSHQQKQTLLDEVINPTQEFDAIPYELKKKRKKKKDNN